MPYADPEARRRVQREAQVRRRAKVRVGTEQGGLMSTPVNPTINMITRLLPPPSGADLDRAGMAINCPRMLREDDVHYHERLRNKWKVIRAILEGG
jgi:hypothetical protein